MVLNPAYTPHYGGHYERLIGLVKKAMEPLYRAPNLTDSILDTVVRRADHLVNARPLAVRVTPDAADPQPITPAHFLRGRIYRRLADVTGKSFIRDWSYMESLVEKFFERFLKGCAPLYNFDYSKDSTITEFKKGDVVWLLNERSSTHGKWPLVKVSDVTTSPDGKVRTVHVQHEGKVLKKAIKDLALVTSEADATTTTGDSGLMVLPPYPIDPSIYGQNEAGAKHIW